MSEFRRDCTCGRQHGTAPTPFNSAEAVVAAQQANDERALNAWRGDAADADQRAVAEIDREIETYDRLDAASQEAAAAEAQRQRAMNAWRTLPDGDSREH